MEDKLKNIVVVFDLHGVVFSSSWRQIIILLWRCPHKIRGFVLLFNPFLMYTMLAGIYKKYVIEQLIETLVEKHPSFVPIKETAIAVANAQKVNKKTLKILCDLHVQQVKLIAFSNIGERSIMVLRERHPEIFELFSHVIHTSAHDNYVAKPSRQAFDKLLVHVNPAEETVIFVDDTRKNLDLACELGLLSVPFLKPRVLEIMLKNLKILN